MSEEILKALMQLFALIVKQDGGMLRAEREYVHNFLKKQLGPDAVPEYMELFDSFSGKVIADAGTDENTPPSVKDSVKIFGICKHINRTLNQSQKVVVLMRLFELVDADNRYTLQRMNIINTVAEVFKIKKEEFNSIESYIKLEAEAKPEDSSILKLDKNTGCLNCDRAVDETDYGSNIYVLRIASVDLFFIKHYSDSQLFQNGLPLINGKVYIIAKGSSLK
ncbi:MAG: TerB family tellurite resistance protein, partial [Bacteroidales bacterium]|nr:TerB family tellurite resistance protein [Bacteroidales bacterium]